MSLSRSILLHAAMWAAIAIFPIETTSAGAAIHGWLVGHDVFRSLLHFAEGK